MDLNSTLWAAMPKIFEKLFYSLYKLFLMKNIATNYYILDKPQRNKLESFFSDASLLFSWILSFIFRRMFISVALGPNELKPQKTTHVMFVTDDRSEKGCVILNLLPPKPERNYFNQKPRFSNRVDDRHLSFKDPVNKAHLDKIITEIGLLIEGKSEQDKCVNKKFTFEDIHLKGLERLDEGLTLYLQQQISEKYGADFFERKRTTPLSFFTLETPDDAILDSIEVASDHEKSKPISERKFLISCMARNQNYMYWLKDFHTSAQHIGCTVIGFNYRGLDDHSKGIVFTQNDLIHDAQAQATRLLKLGAKPENIAFEGMSMGAAVATLTAAKMHEQGYPVKLYNERSYRSLIRMMVGHVIPERNSKLRILSPLIIGLCYLLLAPVIIIMGWHLNAARAWDKIPLACKNYSLAHNHEDPEHYDDDDFIHDSFASIGSLVREHIKEAKHKANTKPLNSEEKEFLKHNTASHEFTLDRSIKENPIPSNHSAPRRFLFDSKKHETSMQTYMIKSLRKVWNVSNEISAESITEEQKNRIPVA